MSQQTAALAPAAAAPAAHPPPSVATSHGNPIPAGTSRQDINAACILMQMYNSGRPSPPEKPEEREAPLPAHAPAKKHKRKPLPSSGRPREALPPPPPKRQRIVGWRRERPPERERPSPAPPAAPAAPALVPPAVPAVAAPAPAIAAPPPPVPVLAVAPPAAPPADADAAAAAAAAPHPAAAEPQVPLAPALPATAHPTPELLRLFDEWHRALARPATKAELATAFNTQHDGSRGGVLVPNGGCQACRLGHVGGLRRTRPELNALFPLERCVRSKGGKGACMRCKAQKKPCRPQNDDAA